MLHLKTLSDLDLRTRLGNLAMDLRATECDLLLHLNELRVRELFAAAGYSSCFTYCVKELGFSEGRACRWLAAGRVIERFPLALTYLEGGKVHATALAMLQKHLTEENHAALLRKAAGRSKRDLEDLIAEVAPKADVPDSIRKRPTRVEDEGLERSAVPEQRGLSFAEGGDATTAASGECGGTKASSHSKGKASGRVAPLSAERVLVKFSASRELEAKVRRAQALLSRKAPHGELEVLFEAALDALLEQVDPERKAVRKARRAAARERKAGERKAGEASRQEQAAEATVETVETVETGGTTPEERELGVIKQEADVKAETALLAAQEVIRRNRYIAADVRLAAWQEAGGQCTYVSADGRRCEERRWLELDHCEPWAVGGSCTLDNLRIYCRGHNAYAARQTFGPWRGAAKQ